MYLFSCLTKHPLSIERADWSNYMTCLKHVTLKHGNANFLKNFRVEFYASNLLSLINQHFSRFCCSYENKCMTKAKHVWLVCWFVRFFAGKLHSRWSARSIFPAKNRTNQQTNKTCFSTKMKKLPLDIADWWLFKYGKVEKKSNFGCQAARDTKEVG